jgi:hypothetical protein
MKWERVPEDYQLALYWFNLSINRNAITNKAGLMYGVEQRAADVVLAQHPGAANGDRLVGT